MFYQGSQNCIYTKILKEYEIKYRTSFLENYYKTTFHDFGFWSTMTLFSINCLWFTIFSLGTNDTLTIRLLFWMKGGQANWRQESCCSGTRFQPPLLEGFGHKLRLDGVTLCCSQTVFVFLTSFFLRAQHFLVVQSTYTLQTNGDVMFLKLEVLTGNLKL